MFSLDGSDFNKSGDSVKIDYDYDCTKGNGIGLTANMATPSSPCMWIITEECK